MMQKNIISFFISFAVTMLFAPLVFAFSKKIKARQTILHYVKEHESKQGTPTMGGIMFIAGSILVALCFYSTDFMFAIVAMGTFFAYGLLGFLDDFIKVHYKQNMGLRAYQKIIGQFGIAFVIAIFVYNTLGGEILVPFTNISFDIGAWIIPLVVLTYVATVNSVNLIDGMDGLCASSSINYLFFLSIILLFTSTTTLGANLTEITLPSSITTQSSKLTALFQFFKHIFISPDLPNISQNTSILSYHIFPIESIVSPRQFHQNM